MRVEQNDTQAPASTAGAMQAVSHDRYGAPELLRVREVPKPVPKADEVLVRVHAAGLHIGDCFGVRGAPWIMRTATGLLKPKIGIPGIDASGVVEAVGDNVTLFRPGDEVFGECWGSCAEYVCAREEKIAPKPANLSFEQAAVLPTSALAALHALRETAKVEAGQSVLINGASGGVGTYAVQIAKSLGAEVTGVCSSRNADMVRSIGADHVVDYTRQDFALGTKRYDVILDNIENRSLSDCRRALTPKGTLILNSGTGTKGFKMLIRLLKPLVISPFLGQNLRRYLSIPNHADLMFLKDLCESQQLRPVVEQTYSLGETAAALQHIEGGHVRGKVVVAL